MQLNISGGYYVYYFCEVCIQLSSSPVYLNEQSCSMCVKLFIVKPIEDLTLNFLPTTLVFQAEDKSVVCPYAVPTL